MASSKKNRLDGSTVFHFCYRGLMDYVSSFLEFKACFLSWFAAEWNPEDH